MTVIRQHAQKQKNNMGSGTFTTPAAPVSAMVFLCLILFFSVSPASCGDMKKIRLTAFDYPPFYSKENGKIDGIAVELIREVFGRMKIETELGFYPLKRALRYMESGEADAQMILIKTAEREKYLHFTEPVMTVRGLIWSAADRKKGAVNFNSLEDLKPYKTGVTLGYSYGQEFDNMLKTMDVDTASGDYNNYRKLLAHRIDIFPGNEIVAKGLFKKHPELKGKFVHSDKSFMEWTLYMGISKKSEFVPMIPGINKVLKELKDEDFISKTVRKYTE
ncbi:MAG: transporter substrate-binding domain-containing protein [Desulfococcaceae bacterium]|nr:transporter substrate-binding domain-containing protein [Desulfococcaceae bacterium]